MSECAVFNSYFINRFGFRVADNAIDKDELDQTCRALIKFNKYLKGYSLEQLKSEIQSFALYEIARPGYGGMRGCIVSCYHKPGTENEIAYKFSINAYLVLGE
jgi:hypothetical protein